MITFVAVLFGVNATLLIVNMTKSDVSDECWITLAGTAVAGCTLALMT